MNINLLGQGFVRPGYEADWVISTINAADWNIEIKEEELNEYTWQSTFVATHRTLGTIGGDKNGRLYINGYSEIVTRFNNEVECYLGDFNPESV